MVATGMAAVHAGAAGMVAGMEGGMAAGAAPAGIGVGDGVPDGDGDPGLSLSRDRIMRRDTTTVPAPITGGAITTKRCRRRPRIAAIRTHMLRLRLNSRLSDGEIRGGRDGRLLSYFHAERAASRLWPPVLSSFMVTDGRMHCCLARKSPIAGACPQVQFFHRKPSRR